MDNIPNTILPENILKYENYKEQNSRLTKALNNHFYLEAIFIEYTIIEDRLTSILRYEGNTIKSNGHVSIEKKLNKVESIAREKKGLANRYFTHEFIESIRNWKEKRNPLVHSLMKQSITSDFLYEIALEGQTLQKELCRLSQNYKRAVERKKKNENTVK